MIVYVYIYTYKHNVAVIYIHIYIYVLREICANMVMLHAKAQMPTKPSKEVARYTPTMVAVVARMEQNSTNMRRCCSASAWETTPINRLRFQEYNLSQSSVFSIALYFVLHVNIDCFQKYDSVL
jgi:hypothetical protein